MLKHSSKPTELTEDDMMGDLPDAITEEKISPSEHDAQEGDKNILEDDKLLQQISLLQEKLAAAEEKILEARADRDNILKRSELRIQDAHKYGVSKLLEELLPVLDSLEQSLNVQESENTLVKNMREGMQLTLQILLKVLDKFGVKEINPVGQEMFNPALHEVMMAQPSEALKPNTIISVMQKGYQVHDRLIRPARVLVSKAPLEKA